MNCTAVMMCLLLMIPAAQAVTSEAPNTTAAANMTEQMSWVYGDYMMVDCFAQPVFWGSRKVMGYEYHQRGFGSLALMLDWCQKNNVDWGWKEGNHGYGQLFYRQNDTQQNPSFGNVKAKPAGYGDASSSNPVGGERLCFVRKDILETHPSWSQSPARAAALAATWPTDAPTTEAPTTAAPTTAAATSLVFADFIVNDTTTTEAPTQGTTSEAWMDPDKVVTVSGEITIQATNVSASLIEQSVARALADHFNISAALITVTARETRRLDATPRRLPGTWDISYEFFASPSQTQQYEVAAADITSDPAAFFSDFTQLVKKYLIEAGVDGSVVNSIVVTGATATVTVPDVTGNGTNSTDRGGQYAWIDMATPNIGTAWLTLLLLLFSMLLM